MPNEHRAPLVAKGKRIAILVSRFNEDVTSRLKEAAVECCVEYGAGEGDVEVYWVAGAFELGQLAAHLARRDSGVDGIVCLGALIEGETSHYHVLAMTVARSIDEVARHSDIPVTFGVITAHTADQAFDRAGGKHGNLGRSSTEALIELMNHWNR